MTKNPAILLGRSLGIEGMIENIDAIYHEATPSLIKAGTTWYQESQTLSLQATGLGDIEKSVAIVAALSPQTSWSKNLEYANTLVNHRKATTLGTSVTKALRILDGEPPLDVLGGKKVRSFFHNLLNPRANEFVTVDRHAVNIALGGIIENSHRYLETTTGYPMVVTAYIEAGKPYGLRGSQIQAITWLAWRTVHASGYASNDPNL